MELRTLGANRTELELKSGSRILFSYRTPVAAYLIGRGYVKTDKKWSRTTSKHIGQWVNGSACAVEPQSFFDTLAEGLG